MSWNRKKPDFKNVTIVDDTPKIYISQINNNLYI